jgi:hypothetical protein
MLRGDSGKQCVEKGFTFFEVQSIKAISLNPNYSGILGLAPDFADNGPSFVARL